MTETDMITKTNKTAYIKIPEAVGAFRARCACACLE
jgi:hypothetical protein